MRPVEACPGSGRAPGWGGAPTVGRAFCSSALGVGVTAGTINWPALEVCGLACPATTPITTPARTSTAAPLPTTRPSNGRSSKMRRSLV